jgi:D-alanine-D-alanine ligase
VSSMTDETRKINLGVIFGGRSGEHEVSLMSARSVLKVVDTQKYEVIQIGITHSGAWVSGDDVIGALETGNLDGLYPALIRAEPGHPALFRLKDTQVEKVCDLDVVFPVLHGTFGEDGTLQGLLELADLAYVGAGVLASSVGMDKALFKDVMRANGLPVVDSIVVSRWQVENGMDAVLAACEEIGSYPLFAKPANLGSSVGITKCRGRSDLYEGLMEAARFDRRILVEQGVLNVREIEVSVLGNSQPEASVPGEILPGDDFYTYNAKYFNPDSLLSIPANLDEALSEHIRELAVRAYRAIDCAGMARVDFLLNRETSEVFIGELNTIPGFTEISMYPKLWEASGISYPNLINRLIELALERKNDRDRTEHQYRRGE